MSEHKSNFPEFYITAPQPCPYIPGKLERKLFTHLTKDKSNFLIDNLLKGASGQAVQNMNILFGLEETAGLRLKANFF